MGPGMIPAPSSAPCIFIDADACPVKEEVYRVAVRYGLHVFVVSNSWINTPREKWIEQIVVDAGPDIADDWIAERITAADVCITSDIPLAARCLARGARAVASNGRVWSADNIGNALAGRAIGQYLREMGVATGGPAPMTKADRSNFLSALDAAAQAALRTPARQTPATVTLL